MSCVSGLCERTMRVVCGGCHFDSASVLGWFGLGWSGLGRALLDQVCLWCWYGDSEVLIKCAGGQDTGRAPTRKQGQQLLRLLVLLLLLLPLLLPVIPRNEKPASIEI